MKQLILASIIVSHCCLSLSQGFDPTAINKKRDELVKKVRDQMEQDDFMVWQMTTAEQQGDLKSVTYEHQLAVSRKSRRSSKCELDPILMGKLINEINLACKFERAHGACESAIEERNKTQGQIAQAQQFRRTNANSSAGFSEAKQLLTEMISSLNSMKSAYRACEGALGGYFNEGCYAAYDSAFADELLIRQIANTCTPDTVENAVEEVINQLADAGMHGDSKVEIAQKAKRLYNQARVDAIAFGETLFQYYKSLVETFPDKFSDEAKQQFSVRPKRRPAHYPQDGAL